MKLQKQFVQAYKQILENEHSTHGFKDASSYTTKDGVKSTYFQRPSAPLKGTENFRHESVIEKVEKPGQDTKFQATHGHHSFANLDSGKITHKSEHPSFEGAVAALKKHRKESGYES